MPAPFAFDWSACRPGTKEVIRTAIEMFTSGKKIMSVNMPTRYGKTPTGILVSGVSTRGWITPEGLHVNPFASVNVWVTVNLMLRKQAANPKKWNKFNNTFSISTPLHYGQIEASYENFKHYMPNNEEYLSVNIHKLIGSGTEIVDGVFLKWIDHLIHTGNRRPPMFHFDESQFMGENKPWGKAILRIMEAGALVMVWTATPQRADGGIIPGFTLSEIGHEERVIGVIEDTFVKDGERYAIVEQRRVRTADYEMHAHVNIPFSESWNNGYLLHANHCMVDVEMSEVDGQTAEDIKSKKLSELTENTIKSNGIIGKVVRNPKVIRQAVEIAYEKFLQYKKINPDAAIAVFTVADRDGVKDEMATRIKTEFLRHNQSLKIDIATLNVDNSSALIEEFVDNDHDVIIFKAMGGCGWDCERICVVLDLGDDRQDAASIQKWMRGGTPDELNNNFALVTLQDALTLSIFNRCVSNEGGKASVSEAEPLHQTITKIEEKVRPMWIVGNVENGDLTSNQKEHASRKDVPLANALFKLIAGFRSQVTDAGLIQKATELGLTVNPSESAVQESSIDEKIDGLRSAITTSCDSAIRSLYRRTNSDYNQAAWSETSKTVYKLVYQRAGIMLKGNDYVPISKNRDIAQLEKLERAAQIVTEEMKRYEDLTV